jgi:hypothetical protein
MTQDIDLHILGQHTVHQTAYVTLRTVRSKLNTLDMTEFKQWLDKEIEQFESVLPDA